MLYGNRVPVTIPHTEAGVPLLTGHHTQMLADSLVPKGEGNRGSLHGTSPRPCPTHTFLWLTFGLLFSLH